DVRRMQQIEPIIIPNQPARRIDILHELLHLISAAVAVDVAQAQNSPAMRIAAERTVSIARYIQSSIWSRRYEDGIIRHRRRGKNRRTKTSGDFYVLQQLGL